MKLTKYGHSCVRIADDSDRRLVIDPGVFSAVPDALDGIDTVLLTHQHPDHVDVEALSAAATRNSELKVWGPRDVVDQLAKVEALADRLTAVGPGESFTAGGLQIQTYGGQHALIHSSVPVVSNVGYLVADTVYHPGDSYTVPTAAVELLLIPISAPWARISDTYDFVISVRAPRAFGIHDAIVSDVGRGMYEMHMKRVGELYGVTRYEHLDDSVGVEL
ncbi:MAG TPA: MBL fold metallo-hydrolase [Jatrophihabitans sp.]|jgi:L-ascorbate metabolism protein UlaG (beta-lactamase superfamily)